MKRLQQQPPPPLQQQELEQVFPNDIFLDIARQSDWKESGAIARCSRSLLRMFLMPVILAEIVDHFKKNKRYRMLKWLVFSLPYEFMRLPVGYYGLLNPEELYKTLDIQPQSRHEFITGGYITQDIYGLEWESDIDIFCHHGIYSNEPRKDPPMHPHKYIDRIYSYVLHLERVIEKFDMSIVQHGYLHDKFYLTPLALYTMHYNDIIVSPSNLNIKYDVPTRAVKANPKLEPFTQILSESPNKRLLKHDIWYFITQHLLIHVGNEHHANTFDKCVQCKELCDYHRKISKWCKRVRKYRKRFPKFTFSYILPSVFHKIDVNNDAYFYEMTVKNIEDNEEAVLKV